MLYAATLTRHSAFCGSGTGLSQEKDYNRERSTAAAIHGSLAFLRSNVSIDQIVISPTRYLTVSPGNLGDDATILTLSPHP